MQEATAPSLSPLGREPLPDVRHARHLESDVKDNVKDTVRRPSIPWALPIESVPEGPGKQREPRSVGARSQGTRSRGRLGKGGCAEQNLGVGGGSRPGTPTRLPMPPRSDPGRVRPSVLGSPARSASGAWPVAPARPAGSSAGGSRANTSWARVRPAATRSGAPLPGGGRIAARREARAGPGAGQSRAPRVPSRQVTVCHTEGGSSAAKRLRLAG
jgi:hypothetical protein